MPRSKTTVTKPRSRATTATPATPLTAHRPSDQEIRDRAYLLFLARGGNPGQPEDDWYAAEAELMAQAS
jgi:hypothetical protein